MNATVSQPKRRRGRGGLWVRVHYLRSGRRTWRKVGDSRQEALHNRNHLVVQLASGEQDLESVPFTSALATFERLRANRVSPTTHEKEQSHLKLWKSHFGRRHVNQIRLQEVEGYFMKRQRAGWAGTTLNQSKVMLRAFFNFCRAHKWLNGEDLTRTIPRYKNTPKKMTVILSPAQVEALLLACREPWQSGAEGRRNTGSTAGGQVTADKRRWEQTFTPPAWLYAIVLAALRTLLRRGDLLDLEWRHVDAQAGLIRLAAKETKNGAEVEIPVGQDLLDVLHAQRVPGESRVFAAAPQDGHTVANMFNRVVRRAGIPRCTFHDLRKTGATQMLREGVPLQVVQAIGGWKNPTVLLKHYTQANLEDKRKAIAILARVAAEPAKKESSAVQ